MHAEVRVGLKEGVDDPEGENTKKALRLLGFNVAWVKVSKIFDIEIETQDKKQANYEVERMCKKLLANPVIHKYTIKIS